MGKRIVIELTESSYDALRKAAKSSGVNPESEAVERILRSLQDSPSPLNPVDAALLEAGLLQSLPDYSKAQAPDQRFMARAVSGKLVSDNHRRAAIVARLLCR